MTVKTSTAFDLETLRRGYEEWDVDALLDLYADDVELIQVDRDNPLRLLRRRLSDVVYRTLLIDESSALSPSPD